MRPLLIPTATILLIVAGTTLSAPVRANSGAVILKTGTVKLADEVQPRGGNTTLTYDDTPSNVVGVEVEWRRLDGWSLGLDFITYDSDWRSSGGVEGDTVTTALLFSAKKYFDATQVVKPYLGAGVGLARVAFTSGGNTTAENDLAYQAVGGIEFRGEQAGLYTEASYFVAEPKIGSNDVNVSGIGYFVGVSVFF